MINTRTGMTQWKKQPLRQTAVQTLQSLNRRFKIPRGRLEGAPLMITLRNRILRNFVLQKTVLRHTTISISALAAFSCAAYGQAPAPTSTTVTTTTSRMSASPTLNTNTNSQPDVTGWSGHPDTDIRIQGGAGKLGVAMANFSVRT